MIIVKWVFIFCLFILLFGIYCLIYSNRVINEHDKKSVD